jgi:hypothetical protein
MRVSLSFHFGSVETGQFVEFDSIVKIEIQDYVFNREMHAESALVVYSESMRAQAGTAYELDLVSDIRLSVHTGV